MDHPAVSTPKKPAARPGRVRIGLSGWTYTGWRGRFYPQGLPHRLELAYAANRHGAIEINGTFYSLQRPESFRSWREQTPEGFVFAVKAPRFNMMAGCKAGPGSSR